MVTVCCWHGRVLVVRLTGVRGASLRRTLLPALHAAVVPVVLDGVVVPAGAVAVVVVFPPQRVGDAEARVSHADQRRRVAEPRRHCGIGTQRNPSETFVTTNHNHRAATMGVQLSLKSICYAHFVWVRRNHSLAVTLGNALFIKRIT